ncbi:unnamed protein product, partial [marine sediment metagenome]
TLFGKSHRELAQIYRELVKDIEALYHSKHTIQ